MKEIVAGIVAHVDAGKTTMCEALLYTAGMLRSLGRVDHGDAFLDTNAMERQRGITIFSKQAVLNTHNVAITLLDTPGHVDFSAETERTLSVLDCAILVVSAADGIEGHTETLWRLLERYHVPTFIFVNKMDAVGADQSAIVEEVQRRFSSACVDCTPCDRRAVSNGVVANGVVANGEVADDPVSDSAVSDSAVANGAVADSALFDASSLDTTTLEEIAVLDETAMEEYVEHESLSLVRLQTMVASRKLFPCFFGSALKLEGVSQFLTALSTWSSHIVYGTDFGAKVYNISHDNQGNRLTWLKVTGGSLHVKDMLTNGVVVGEFAHDTEVSNNVWREKVDQIRNYSGAKFNLRDEVQAGSVCAVTGLMHTFAGEGLGFETDGAPPVLQPVLSYTLLADPQDIHKALAALRVLEDEDPLLHVHWDESVQEVRLQLMGSVQLEIVQQMLQDRFALNVSFGQGTILYKETIESKVEGVGHFEPLRHYAEVHLLLEPAERGSGLSFASTCSEDVLDRNWQRLVLTHLQEREHLGVLTGAPITDMRITLLTGRAHAKHTEGGDFRQATYRAVRQGLMKAKSRLLEPWYEVRLEVPQECLGRAMSDIQRMGGELEPAQIDHDVAVISGFAPVAQLGEYSLELNTYTHGKGRIGLVFDGYRDCHNEQEIIDQEQYNPESDLDNTPDSVFCAHGSGYPVKWNRVEDFMHLEGVKQNGRTSTPELSNS